MLDSAISISFSYFINTVCILYAQYLALGAPEPAVDFKYAGAAVFAIGMLGNLYHHCLLSKLRKKGDELSYKIPEGGLFGLVICPHYLFEILIWVGVALMAQTLNASSFMLGSAFYLMGRSWATKRWYISKFESFPKGIKALLPYIYWSKIRNNIFSLDLNENLEWYLCISVDYMYLYAKLIRFDWWDKTRMVWLSLSLQ